MKEFSRSYLVPSSVGCFMYTADKTVHAAFLEVID